MDIPDHRQDDRRASRDLGQIMSLSEAMARIEALEAEVDGLKKAQRQERDVRAAASDPSPSGMPRPVIREPKPK